jgi:hypothetical protein
MTAYNVVRFRVKPGRDQEFIDLHRKAKLDFNGWRSGALVKIGDQSYCLIGEWDRFDNIVTARPGMIGMLDSFRDMLRSGIGRERAAAQDEGRSQEGQAEGEEESEEGRCQGRAQTDKEGCKEEIRTAPEKVEIFAWSITPPAAWP